MATNVRDYLLEKGMRRELALELDEITLAMHSRIARFSKQGVDKHLILIDLGKYRHMEQRSPKSLLEMLRVVLDFGLLVLNFNDRFRILEHYAIVKLNYVTGEYEFTEFGKQFFVRRTV